MTANQINYMRVLQDKIHNEAVRQETKRVNLINEELKRIDQALQRDLNEINARYKEKQYQLDKHDMEFQHRMSQRRAEQTDRQISIDAGRVQTTMRQNEINALAQQETARANKMRESLEQQSINIDRAKLPYQIENITSTTTLNRASTVTESKRPNQVQSQTFSNYANPILNALTGLTRTALPFILAK